MNINYSIQRIFDLNNDIINKCAAIASLQNTNNSIPHSFFYDEIELSEEDQLPVMYVAKICDEVIGFISTYYLDDSIEICSFVHPQYCGQGVFKSMYQLLASDYEGYDVYVGNPLRVVGLRLCYNFRFTDGSANDCKVRVVEPAVEGVAQSCDIGEGKG